MLVLKKNVYRNCLELYTIDSWKETLDKLKAKHSFEQEYEDMVRDYTDGNSLLEIDGSNRILLPKLLMEHANLKKEVLLKSQLDKIEIWSVEGYEEYKKNFDKQKYAAIVKQVMGKKSEE